MTDCNSRDEKVGRGRRAGQFCSSVAVEAWLTSWELIKITVPVLLITKLLEELGLIGLFSGLLAPLMAVIGLPGELGLVWATAMLTSLYGGIGVLAVLAPTLTLTVVQVTVLASAMLIAHSLPLELSISKRAGARLLPIAVIRLTGAIVYAFLLYRFCRLSGIWQDEAKLLFSAAPAEQGLLQWGLSQLQNLAFIIVVILGIVLAMRILRAVGFLGKMEKILAPLLPPLGMSHRAAPITVVGMLMGIGYGGALIIRETTTGKLDQQEIFYSMALMGLCHGLIEDTLLMMAIGGALGGIFWGRIVFSMMVVFLLVKAMRYYTLARGR